MKATFKNIVRISLMLCSLSLIPLGLQAQVDPKIVWKEIETESAYWLFDARHQESTEYAVMQFERAKKRVLPLFKEPSRKMTIILLDNTDLSNGSAQVTPHPIMTLYPVLPSHQSAIGEYNDYLYELLVHEYTHILNMEPVHGFIRPFYWIFGSIAHPNMILPRWYTEGLAVYTESYFSRGGGRLNSQYLEGMARSLTLEKKWTDYPLSDLNDDQPDWLGASRAYLFGGILWDGIVQSGGIESIYKFNQSYSRRIPYFLDGVIVFHLGLNYNQQLEKIYQYWQHKAQAQIDQALTASYIQAAVVTPKSGSYTSPSVSPDGLWMAYIKKDHEANGDIYLTLRHPKKAFLGYQPRKVVEKTMGEKISWHPSGDGFVYEKLDTYDRYYRYFDLYYYSVQNKRSHRLSRGARAHSSCFSERGHHLYYLQNRMGSKQIIRHNWGTKKEDVVYRGSLGENIQSLSCLNDERLYFVQQHPGEKRRPVELNLQTLKLSTALSENPTGFMSQSHKGLLFSSAQSGIENLYLAPQNNFQKQQAISNSLTRIIDGELDPLTDDLYYSELTAEGFKIKYLNAAQWESLADSPPQVERIFQSQYNDSNLTSEIKSQPEAQAETTSTPQLKAQNFSPWRYLYPNHWIPFLYLVDGGTLFQALTSAGDPLGINSISLVGQWDTLTKKPGASLSYLNRSLPVAMGFAVSDFYSFFYNDRSTLHFSNASLIMAYPLAFLDSTQMLFRWKYSALEFGNSIFIRQGPQLEISYRNLKQNRNDISTSSGWRSELGHKSYLTDLGNENYEETYAHLGTFWSSFTPKRHVLYWGLNGSYAPQLTNGFFATSTLAGPFLNPQITNTTFLQRGYPTGVFVARNILNTNLEYRFPIMSYFSGFTAPPLFLKNLQGAFVFDATTFDGRYSSSLTNTSNFTEFGRWFSGYGLELETNMNVGFHVPLTFTLGLYYGQEQESFGGFTTFFNVRL